jgi:dTDP-glucose pyrophosphorylase|tara:strand:+ start:1476 stop:2543 length:1068 start_codon:yes stop_codon:yes gene_type:complete
MIQKYDQNLFIKKDDSLDLALKKLSSNNLKCLVVINGNKKVLGTVTDGDIRRAIVKYKDISLKIKKIYNPKFYFFTKSPTNPELKNIFSFKKFPLIPQLNKTRKVIKIFFIENFINHSIKEDFSLSDKVDAVIMAGGKGSRLSPFTNILPKPLIPIKGKPVIDHIIESFQEAGVNCIYITLNFKGKIIKSYLSEKFKKNNIKYINEKTPLGTASSLSLIKNKIKDNIVVVNCDTILNLKLSNLMKAHLEEKNAMTMVTVAKNHILPYGLCEANKKNKLKKINEKPNLKFLINVGMYVIHKKYLNLIPKNKKFGMDDLINILLKKKKPIGIYPIAEESWTDLGQWTEYYKAVEKFN